MPAVVSLALLAKSDVTLEHVLISHLTVEQKARAVPTLPST